MSQKFANKRRMTSDDEDSDSSVGSSRIGSLHDLSEYIGTMQKDWKQYLNTGRESIYDLLTGAAVFNVPAAAVPKTELELLFEERDAEEVLENLGFGFDPGTSIPERFIQHENKKAGISFKLTDLDDHFNAAIQDNKIPTRYLEAGNLEVTLTPRYPDRARIDSSELSPISSASSID